MPKKVTIEQFIKAVESNKHDLAIEQFYTDDASIQENQNPPRVGKAFLVENEARTFAKAKSVSSKCIRPYFISGNTVVIRWYFRFEWKNETHSEIEEIAYQEWQGELVHKEQLFFISHFSIYPKVGALSSARHNLASDIRRTDIRFTHSPILYPFDNEYFSNQI